MTTHNPISMYGITVKWFCLQ